MIYLERLFEIDYNNNDSVAMLKKKIKIKKCKNINTDHLIV